MTREDKIEYMRIALSLQKIVVDNETADRIIETYETVLKLEDNLSIKDVVKIEAKMDKKYNTLEIKARENEKRK